VYALLFDDGWWYVGEAQTIAARRGAHRVRRGRKQEVAVWYILVPASKERKVVQGNIITSLHARPAAKLCHQLCVQVVPGPGKHAHCNTERALTTYDTSTTPHAPTPREHPRARQVRSNGTHIFFFDK
jgi:hypothetical protein